MNNTGERVVFENVENDYGDSARGMAKINRKGDPIVLRFNYKKIFKTSPEIYESSQMCTSTNR